jgi:electron transfer flavoprotein beta subunit
MKIIVCVKQVPDTETRVKIGASGSGIQEEGVNWIVSPYDEFAVEEALKIKEAKGGEVVLVSLGPDRVQAALRNGLAMGADSAVHLKDPLFDATDTLGAARALAAAINGVGGFDLVLTGQQGVGGDNGQVPALLAELLDLPQVTMAVKVEIQDGRAAVEREIEGAREVWETSLPAVLSAQKGLNEPRYPTLKGIMGAKRKEIKDLKAGDVGLAGAAPQLSLVGLEALPPRPPGRIIPGDVPAAVKELVRSLREDAKAI